MNTQTIHLNGKDHPIKFTYSSLLELEKLQKKNFTEIAADLGKGNMTSLVVIAFIGLKTAARINKNDFTLTIEEVGDMLKPDSLEDVTKAFGDAFAPPEEVAKSNEKQDSEKKP